MTNLEKQLIAMMAHGIWIEFHSGHRYIRCMENQEEQDGETYNGYNFHDELIKHNFSINNKIYGGVKECILIVDEVFTEMYGYDLLDFYKTEIDTGFDVEYISDSDSRIDYNNGNGLV